MFNTRQIKIGAKYQFSNGVDGVAGIGAIVQAVCPNNSMLKCDGNKAWLLIRHKHFSPTIGRQ